MKKLILPLLLIAGITLASNQQPEHIYTITGTASQISAMMAIIDQSNAPHPDVKWMQEFLNKQLGPQSVKFAKEDSLRLKGFLDKK